jgi:hypothetical protein
VNRSWRARSAGLSVKETRILRAGVERGNFEEKSSDRNLEKRLKRRSAAERTAKGLEGRNDKDIERFAIGIGIGVLNITTVGEC